jgi:hypothetical protein
MILNKGQADRLLREMYKLLREGDVHLRLRSIHTGHLGFFYPSNQDVEIDPHGDPLRVVVHELAHAIYGGDTPEETIEQIEEAMNHHLSDRQWRNLWCAVADALRAEK